MAADNIGMFGWMGKMAMANGRFEEAAMNFTEGLNRVPRRLPQLAATFLMDRSECFWQLCRYEHSFHDMTQATEIGLPALDVDDAEDRALKWFQRGKNELQRDRFENSQQCFSFALCFEISSVVWKAEILSYRAAALFFLGKTIEAKRDIQRCNLFHRDLSLNVANYWKDAGIKTFKQRNYQRAVKQLQLARLFNPHQDLEFQRSLLSHMASALFALKDYKQSIETGNECYRLKSTKNKSEGERWKERGNDLFKDQNYKLSIECYTLSLNYMPAHENNLAAVCYSNRSLAYLKGKCFSEALRDARNCARLRPKWSKAHYRIGSSLAALGMYGDALAAFTSALAVSTQDEDPTDTLSQILSLALKVEEQTQSVTCTVNRTVVQKLVVDAIENKDWNRLCVLFMGGGSERKYKRGEGGLATGCNASLVPLDDVIRTDFERTEKVHLVKTLIKHGASVNGVSGCKKSPLEVAHETKQFELMRLLHQEGAHDDVLTAEVTLKKLKEEGIKYYRKQDYRNAVQLFKKVMDAQKQHGLYSFDDRYKIAGYMADAYFKLDEFSMCATTGHEMFSMKPEKSQELAELWKERGNALIKAREKVGNSKWASNFYSLAMSYTNGTNIDTMAKLLSNRSLSYLYDEQYQAALTDAENCIKLKPDWFRGHFRMGSAFIGLKKSKEALSAFCKSYTQTTRDDEREVVASEIVSTAMQVPDGTSLITCSVCTDILDRILKDAVTKKDWEKIRFLFLGDDDQRLSTSEIKPPLGCKCDGSVVPIEKIIQASVSNTFELVQALLERGAPVNGQHGCEKAPLAVAAEKKDYTMAAALLRHGADSSSIVLERNQEFIARGEKEARYWLALGKTLLKQNREHRNAIIYLNICLELSDPETDRRMRYDAYFSLADEYFELRWYDECLEAGQQCFRLKPEKSELEAMRWSSRSRTVREEKRYHFCVEFSTLAIKYVPAAMHNSFVPNMLMNCAYARMQMNEFHKALDDLTRTVKISQQFPKAYEYQGDCCVELKRPKEAIQAYGKFLQMVGKGEKDEDLNRVLRTVISLATESGEGTAAVTVDPPKHIVEKILREIIQKKEWNKLSVMFLGGGGAQRHPAGRGGLASGCGAKSVPLEEIVTARISKFRNFERNQLVSVLVDNGVSVNGLSDACKPPLVTVMEQKNLHLVNKLLEYGADPGRSSSGGSTPLHFALQLGIEKEKWVYLYALLQRSKVPEAKNAQDKQGNSLFHIASFGKSNKKKCTAINILTENGVNPHLRNKPGKRAIDCVKNDRRFKLLQTAMDRYKVPDLNQLPGESTKESSSKEIDEQAAVATPAETWPQVDDPEEAWDVERVSDQNTTVAPEAKQVPPKMDKRQKSRDEMYRKVLNLIENYDFKEILREYEQEKKAALDHQQEYLQQVEVEDEMEEMEEVASEATLESNIVNPEEARDEESMDIDSPFENLPWEVDCTDQVWKVMQSKRVSSAMKKRIIGKIRMLAEGRWNANLCKRLEGTAKKKDICLYEAKLTKGARILWEKTVAFSCRCSQNPELRVKTDDSEGRVYSDIIRVWDIALAHDTVEHKIDNIVKSHERGRDCIIKTNLKGFKRNDLRKDFAGECLPNYYLEKTEDQKKKEENKTTLKREPTRKPTKEKELVELFCPPASANEQEYHILKFYSFNSALVHTILQCDSTRVDFPFKVTEREYDVINLCPSPPSPIILLGRSGTGKTTCCLYRLWREFETYWKGASKGGPHIPKYVTPEPLQTNNTEGAESLDASSSQSSSLNCQEEETQEAENESGCYEHLHQLFVTKNSVLCSEVQKNFRELSHACPDAKDHIAEEDHPLPTRFQEIRDTAWPLFINSRDFLLMLDASLPSKPYPGPFFQRDGDGTLLRQVDGWGEEDNNLSYIPSEDSDEEEIEEEENQNNDLDTDHDRGGKSVSAHEKQSDPRREITYNVFRNEIWPKMIKIRPKLNYHPTLVWMEIRSFIKGSAEALLADNGHLSLEDYLELGRKRAPNFSDDDRRVVYQLFQIYQRHRKSNRMFDESDLVFNLQRRLQEAGAPEWSIHRLYVDETQDFTQAELSLLIRCCRHPNDLFFTGDTAQSIMRGIAFRFSDLKSLFYHANRSTQTDTRRGHVRVPDRLYQLVHNYRSHSGILRLASSVVDLLLHFFPDSFDRLEKDQGLFDGPKPVILESCSLTDLAMILRGNRRQTSRIEFGAHQVVLVASEEARESVPEELRHGLVMTIYEAKGLEFDDVLIYNFFKDSQARKEWRVVSSYVNKECHTTRPTGLVEIKEEELVSKTRPLDFDSDKHKVLNSEFKYLYTAITRARVNVWLFDEDLDARSPMFEYFQKLRLVKVESLREGDDDAEPLTSMFAERSTAEEWLERGHYFYKKRLWKVAAKCFVFAGEDDMMLRSKAHQQAEDAHKLRGQPRVMREEFLKAAFLFLNCGMIEEAEICLHNAKQRYLLATLCKRTRKFQQAAKLYKKERDFVQASECCEMVNDYGQAIEILCQANKFDRAMDVLERYKALSPNESQLKEVIVPPKATRTIERLCFQLADDHFKNSRIPEMKAVLARLPSALDRIEFLKSHGFYEEVARAFEESGKPEAAAQLLMVHGKFKEASRLSSKPKFVADCFMALARTTLERNPNDSETVLDYLKTAQMNYKEAKDKNGLGDAQLLSGKVQGNVKVVEEAGRTFNSARNDVGEAETVETLFELTKDKASELPDWILVRTVHRLLSLIHALAKPAKLTTEDHKRIATCKSHFGLKTSSESQEHLTYLHSNGCRFTKLNNYSQGQQTVERVIHRDSAQKLILSSLANLSVKLVRKIRCLLQESFAQNTICRAFNLGFTCVSPNCIRQHTNDSRQFFVTRFYSALNLVYLDAAVSNFVNNVASIKEAKKLIDRLMTEDVQYFNSCKTLYGVIFPEIGMQGVHLTPRHLVDLRKKGQMVKKRIVDFADYSWESAGSHRRTNVNVFIPLFSTLQLISCEDKAKRWVYKEEKDFESEAKKEEELKREAREKKTVQPARNGMVEDKQRRGQFSSFLRWWENGKNLLHVHGDIVNSAHYVVRRFLSLPVSRSSMAKPSISHTLMILEYQLTVCLAMCSRLNASNLYPVCLPESYLKAVEIWNMVSCTNENYFELFDALDRTARNTGNSRKVYNDMQSLLKYMVELTCGVKYKHFDVVSKAFGNEPRDYTSQMERTFVLALSMLCNSGSDIPAACQSLILKSLWKITLGPHVPSRIKDAFQSLKAVTKISDVVVLLTRFLKSRGESLFDLRWNGRFDAVASVATYYPAEFGFDVSAMQAEYNESGVEQMSQHTEVWDDLDEDVTEIEESEAMLLKLKLREERERADKEEAAAITIQRYFRRRIKVKKQEQFEEPPAEIQVQQEEGRFIKFAVDNMTCGICGVSFIPSYETKDFVEADTGTEEKFSLEGDLHQDLEASQLKRSSHIASSSHIEKEEMFTLFKNFYNNEVLPLLQRERRLRSGDDNEVAGNTQRPQVEGLDLLRLSSARSVVIQCVQQIEESLKWTVTKELHDAIKKFGKTIQEVENLVNQVTDDGRASGALRNEEDEYALGIEEDDVEEDELKDIPGKSKAKGKQTNKRKRKRKKQKKP